MKKFVKAIFVLILISIIIILSSCSGGINEGYVHDKEYIEGSTITIMTTRLAGKSIMTFPQVISYPEKYIITIRNTDNGVDTYRKFNVSKHTYEQYDIGDYFSYSNN